jgi:hypothetical protein
MAIATVFLCTSAYSQTLIALGLLVQPGKRLLAGHCEPVVQKLQLVPERQQVVLALCNEYTKKYNQCYDDKIRGLKEDQIITGTATCKSDFEGLIASINTK